tara:strand:+ start:771 stop:1073 length:303 start_codon:yes stop_codon:yes gene_type:complete
MGTFTKTFTGVFQSRHYYSSIDVDIEVDFVGIESQQELDKVIDAMDSYTYIVKSIIGQDDDCHWVELKDECLYEQQADRIDTIIADALDKEASQRSQIKI